MDVKMNDQIKIGQLCKQPTAGDFFYPNVGIPYI